ncbi:hypothetical protein EDB80DRAFT_807385 [Ilyonectria destructans]|nr:hypothetical protein EDB80DRAFT_807385 [Ilyonectria destructans]
MQVCSSLIAAAQLAEPRPVPNVFPRLTKLSTPEGSLSVRGMTCTAAVGLYISGLHMRESLSPSRPINQTCSEHTHSPHPSSTAFLPPLPVLPPMPPSPAPAAGHVPRAQRSVPERTPPLLTGDSDGLGAAPEEGPRGLNTHPPELAPSLDSRQLGLRSKASNDVVNQKGPSMSQSLGHDACFLVPVSHRL